MNMNEIAHKLLSVNFHGDRWRNVYYIEIGKNQDNKFTVNLEASEGTVWRLNDGYLDSGFGKGNTIEEAMSDYYNNLLGKKLVVQYTEEEEYESDVIE